MSDVEIYWQKIAEKYGDTRKWQDLSPNAQHLIIQSINALLYVLSNPDA